VKLFINLPVRDLERSRAFFSRLGFAFVAGFSGPDNLCMKIGEEQFIMLLTRPRFSDFVVGDVADPEQAVGLTVSVHLENKEEVVGMVETARSLGARENLPPADYGFMYGWSFLDLDGYLWEPFWMDSAHAQQQVESGS
jgi:predicted lactoylglutathione lyase